MSAQQTTPPTDLLFNVLVILLTPLFLGGASGNADFTLARAAAIEMLGSFRIRTPWDLLTAVQTVGFAMAALGSLGLSMTEDLSVNAVLRCRSNANALQRSSDRAQDRMDKRQASNQPHAEPLDVDAMLGSFRKAADAQQAVAEARARLAGEAPPAPALQAETRPETPQPKATPVPPAPAASASILPIRPGTPEPGSRLDQENKAMWAGAMATVAAEFAQEMEHMSPAEQRANQQRINALTAVTNKLSKAIAPSPNALLRLGVPNANRPAAAG
jgi:hypothetical protein